MKGSGRGGERPHGGSGFGHGRGGGGSPAPRRRPPPAAFLILSVALLAGCAAAPHAHADVYHPAAGLTPVVAAEQSGPTNASTIWFTVEFGGNVTGFNASGVAVSGTAPHGGVAGFAGGGASYSFAVSPESDGTILVDIPAGAALDAAGNATGAAGRFLIVYDGTPPVPAIAPALQGPAGLRAVPFTVEFGEPVNASTLDASDIDAFPGDVENLRFAPQHGAALGSRGSGDGRFAWPSGAAVDGAGNVYVADTGNHRVQVFDSFWNHTATIGAYGSGDGRFYQPGGIAVDGPTGAIYVADTGNHRVQVFDSSLNHTATIGAHGSGDGRLNGTSGVAVDGAGNVYVADTGNHRVQVFDSSLEHTATIGSFGSGDGRFYQPGGIAVDGAGNVYVADTGNHRVQVFDSSLNHTATIGSFGSGDGRFYQPGGIAVDGAGNVYVADTGNHRVQVFDSSLEHTATVGAYGSGDGRFYQPGGVAVDGPTGAAYVADTGNHRVQAFDPAYAFDVVNPAVVRSLAVSMPAGRVQDAAGNANEASNIASIGTGGTGPIPAVAAALPGPTGVSAINFTVDFGESVTGFGARDVVISGNASHGGVEGFARANATAFAFSVSPTSDGTILVDIPAGAARDLGGNPSRAAERFLVVYDGAPTPVVSAEQHGPANATIRFTVEFGENVTWFGARDVVISGNASHGGVANFSGSGASYAFSVSPTSDGTILVDIPAGAARDLGGNPSRAAEQFSIVYDGAPTPVVSAEQSGPTNATTIWFTVEFGENVTGFTPEDVVISGNASHGGAYGFARANATAFTFSVSPTRDGTILVDIPAGAARDLGGNPSRAAERFLVVYDGAPTPVVSAEQSGPTNATTIWFTVEFGENVTWFEAWDVVLSGSAAHGGVANFAAANATAFTFSVSPTRDGTILVDIPAGAAEDLAGNPSRAAEQFSIVYDGAPTPVVSAEQSGPTNATTIWFTVNFGENVTGFEARDVAVSGTASHGGVEGFAGGSASYSFGISPESDGTILVVVPANAAWDAAGNNNTAAERFFIAYDGTPPVPAIVPALSGPTNLRTVPFAVEFGEPVNALTLDASDIDASSGAVRNLRFAPQHNATFGAYGWGYGQFGDMSSIAVDGAGNIYVADTNNSRVLVFDSGNHSATIGSYGRDDGQFSDPRGVAVDVSTGAIYVADTGNHRVQVFDSSLEHTATVGSYGRGDGRFYQPRGVAVDGAGNVYVADTNNSRVQVFDSSLEHTATVGSYGSGDGRFYQPRGVAVDGAGNVYVADTGNHRVQVFDSSLNHSATIGSFGSGDGRFYQPGGIAVDGAGNVYVADTGNHRVQVFDSSLNHSATIGSSGWGDGRFYHPHGVAVDGPTGAIYVADTGNSRFQVFDPAYAFDVADPAGGQNLTASMPAGRVQDAAGNANEASDAASIGIDRTRPTTTVSAAQSSPTNASTIRFTVNFSKPVTGFEARDVAVSGTAPHGGVEGFAGGGSLYSFGVSPTGDGTILVDIAAGAAQDAAGNNNTAAGRLAIAYDGGPTPAVSAAQSSPTNAPTIRFAAEFGENVTGFEARDVAVSGTASHGGAKNFAGAGASYSFEVSPTSDGTILVHIPAGAARDAAGSGSRAEWFFITHDGTPPVPAIAPVLPSPADLRTVQFAVGFGEPMGASAMDASYIDASSGTVRNLRFAPQHNATFGSHGSGDGQFNDTSGVAVDGAGNVYVADTGNHRVQVFDSSRNHSASFGSYGRGDGQFSDPRGVAVDGAGNVYVADTGNHRVQVFDPNWNHSGTIGPGRGDGRFYHPHGVAVDGAGNVYVADTYNSRVQVFDPEWNHSSTISSFGWGEGRLYYPRGVAVDGAGNVYVADTYGSRVQVFDSSLNHTATIGSYGQGDGRFSYPYGVAVDGAGNVYVADTYGSRVQVFNSSLNHAATIGSYGQGDGRFYQPGGVAVDGAGNVYVADTYNNRVQVFDPAYAFDVANPAGVQSLTASMPAGRVQDAAGNANEASNIASIGTDRTGPTPVVEAAQRGPANSTTINFTVNFGENVTGFAPEDIVISGNASHGGAYGFARANATAFTFSVSPTRDGTVLVDIPAGAARDLAGNPSEAAEQFSIVYDGAPTPVVEAAQSGTTNATTIWFTVNFGENVTWFEARDVVISGSAAHGGVADFAAANATAFEFSVSPTSDGTVLVDIPAGAAEDLAGNPSRAAERFSIIYDGAPTPVVSAARYGQASSATINFTVNFGENVTGFAPEDIVISGNASHGGAYGFARANATAFTFSVSPTRDGTILVDIPAGAARDLGGNPSRAAERFLVVYDGAPTPVVEAAQRGPTNSTTIDFTVEFGENVTGFAPDDVVISGNASRGGPANFSGSGASYSFGVSPARDGAILVDIPAGAARDLEGNPSAESGRFSIMYDGTAPTVLSAAITGPNQITVRYSEPAGAGISAYGAATVGGAARASGAAHGGGTGVHTIAFAGDAAARNATGALAVNRTAVTDPAGNALDPGPDDLPAPEGGFRVYAVGAVYPQVLADGQGPSLVSALLDLTAGENGRLVLEFDEAAAAPDAQSFGGSVNVATANGTISLRAGDVPSVSSGHAGDRAFGLDLSGAARVRLNAADLESATISLPAGFVSDVRGNAYAGNDPPAVPLGYVQDPTPPRLVKATVNLAQGAGAGRLTLVFNEAATAPDLRRHAGDSGTSSSAAPAAALSAGDITSVERGRTGDRAFGLLVSDAKREELGGAGPDALASATVSLPAGFVSNGRAGSAPAAAPLEAGRDSAGPSFVRAFVSGNDSVTVVYTEPVLTVPAHYTGMAVDGSAVAGNSGGASAAAAFGSSVTVSWNAGAGTAASAGSVAEFGLSGNVTDSFGNPLANPGPKSTGEREAGKRHVQVGVLARGPGDPSAWAARLGAEAFNDLAAARGHAFLLDVSEYDVPAGASGAAAEAVLRDAHDNGRGPVLYVGPASDRALRGMAGYAAENGITLVSHSSAARPLAVEGDGVYRLEPGAAHMAKALAHAVARGGFDAVVPVAQAGLRGQEYGLLGPLESYLAPLGIHVGRPVEFAGGGGAAGSVEAAVARAAGNGSGRSVAVVYLGSDSGFAEIAGGARAGGPAREAAWFAAGGAGAGAGDGLAASPLIASDAAAVRLARDTRLSAVQFAVERSAATDRIDRITGAPPGSPTPAYAAYEAARAIGGAVALAGGDPSGAGARVIEAAALDGGPLGRIGLDRYGDLRLPITYGVWSVSNASAGWERAPGLLRGIDTCEIKLEKPSLALPDLSPGRTSGPARQTITNTGTVPMPDVSVSGGDWVLYGLGGTPTGGTLPPSLTEMSAGPAGFAPLAEGAHVRGGTPAGGSVGVDFRLDLTGVPELDAAYISQTVTYGINC